MRIESSLDSLIRNDFCKLASKDQNPNLVRELGCSWPISPGLALTSTYLAGSALLAASRLNAPGDPAVTLWARARSRQPAESPANPKPLLSVWAICAESKHCGSRRVV